jgi:hypothetical protein
MTDNIALVAGANGIIGKVLIEEISRTSARRSWAFAALSKVPGSAFRLSPRRSST